MSAFESLERLARSLDDGDQLVLSRHDARRILKAIAVVETRQEVAVGTLEKVAFAFQRQRAVQRHKLVGMPMPVEPLDPRVAFALDAVALTLASLRSAPVVRMIGGSPRAPRARFVSVVRQREPVIQGVLDDTPELVALGASKPLVGTALVAVIKRAAAEIHRRCVAVGYRAPSYATVRSRVEARLDFVATRMSTKKSNLPSVLPRRPISSALRGPELRAALLGQPAGVRAEAAGEPSLLQVRL